MSKQDKPRMASHVAGAVVLGLALTVWAGAPSGRYLVDAGTVFDTTTNLTWQQAVPDGGVIWSEAQSSSCLDAGWRLPTIRELQTLVDARAFSPTIDRVAFPSTPGGRFWSSTPYAMASSSVWVVPFDTGLATSSGTGTSNFAWVRCVR